MLNVRTYKDITKTRFNLVGQRFGKLVVVGLLGSHNNKHYWKCVCDCGGYSEVSSGSLRVGNSKSCGCEAKNRLKEVSVTHGMSKHPLYGVWRRMIQRCEDKNCSDYKYYGARGVTVCERWHDFSLFYSDVGERPEGMTLERIDNEKGYQPENVRWATRREQMQNTRSAGRIQHNGECLTISELAIRHGIKPRTLHARLNRLGYSLEQALEKEVKPGAMLNGKNWRSKC